MKIYVAVLLVFAAVNNAYAKPYIIQDLLTFVDDILHPIIGSLSPIPVLTGFRQGILNGHIDICGFILRLIENIFIFFGLDPINSGSNEDSSKTAKSSSNGRSQLPIDGKFPTFEVNSDGSPTVHTDLSSLDNIGKAKSAKSAHGKKRNG